MVLTWWILFNYFFMLVNFILPYIFIIGCNMGQNKVSLLRLNPNKTNLPPNITVIQLVNLSMLFFTLYTLLFESFFVCFLNSRMGLKCNCGFYLVKLASGCLRRLMGIIHAGVAALMLDSET